MTKGLASEMAEYNVRVNALAPGLVVTPINKPLRDDPGLVCRLHRPHGAQTVESAVGDGRSDPATRVGCGQLHHRHDRFCRRRMDRDRRSVRAAGVKVGRSDSEREFDLYDVDELNP